MEWLCNPADSTVYCFLNQLIQLHLKHAYHSAKPTIVAVLARQHHATGKMVL